jgi:hypothetical protein
MELSRGGQIYYYESLYEQYSRLNFSFDADRSVAIDGLERRISRALGDIGAFGVFKKNLGRGLLWRRGLNVPQLVRIDFSTDANRGRRAPSWSWMSYVGGIDYLDTVGGSVTWEKSTSWDTENGGMTLKGYAREFDIPSNTPAADARIAWDDSKDKEDGALKCMVVGTEKLGDNLLAKKHYVLIVQQDSGSDNDNIYQRVAIGEILGRFIRPESQMRPILIR